MLITIAVATMLAAPDPSTRSFAWRVTDVQSGVYKCEYACSTTVVDAARDTYCLQAAASIATSASDTRYRSVELPPGDCLLNSTLSFTSTRNLEVYGQGSTRTRLVWNAGTAADPVLLLDDVADSQFHDFGIALATGKTATSGIKWTNGAGSSVTPTNVLFERITIDGTLSSTWLGHGIELDSGGGGGDANLDFMTAAQVRVIGHEGDGFRIEGTQSKTHTFSASSCLGSSRWLKSSVDTAGDTITFNSSVAAWKAVNDPVVLFPQAHTASATTIDPATDRLTFGAAHGLAPNDAVILAAVTNVTNISGGVRYFVYDVPTPTTIRLSTSSGGGLINIAGAAGTGYVSAGVLPSPLVAGTTYYIKTLSTAVVSLSATPGGATIDLVTTGSGTVRMIGASGQSNCVHTVNGGSFIWTGGGGGYQSGYDFKLDNLSEAAQIIGSNTEYSRKFLYKGAGTSVNAGLAIQGVRFDPSGVDLNAGTADQQVIYSGYQGLTTIMASSFASHGETGARPMTAYFNPSLPGANAFINTEWGSITPSAASVFSGGEPALIGAMAWGHTEQKARGMTSTSMFIDAGDFGLDEGNSASDNTAALQAALDAVSRSGTLRIPNGTFQVSGGLTRTTPITIVGVGPPSTTNRGVFGDASWVSGAVRGSVLFLPSSVTSGALLTLGSSLGGRYVVRDLALVHQGATTDTVTGLSVSSSGGTMMVPAVHNVLVANMETGVECTTCVGGTFDNLLLYGNEVGVEISADSTGNSLNELNAEANTTAALVAGDYTRFTEPAVTDSEWYGLRATGVGTVVTGGVFVGTATAGAAISLERDPSWFVVSVNTSTETLTLDTAAPADDTQVIVWADGSAGAVPTAVPAIAYGTAYYVYNASGNTLQLRTAAGGGGSLLNFSTAGAGLVRMSGSTATGGWATVRDVYLDAAGDSIAVWTNENTVDGGYMNQPIKFHTGTESNVASYLGVAALDYGIGNVRISGYGVDGVYYTFTGVEPGLTVDGTAYSHVGVSTDGGLIFRFDCVDATASCRIFDAAGVDDYLNFVPDGGGIGVSETSVDSDIMSVVSNATFFGSLAVNAISERTAANGVVIDGVTAKDGYILTGGDNDGILSPSSIYGLIFNETTGSGTLTLGGGGAASSIVAGAGSLNITAGTVDMNGDLVIGSDNLNVHDRFDVTPKVLYNQTGLNATTSGTVIETVATVTIPANTITENGGTLVVEGVILKDADANSVTFEVDHSGVEQILTNTQSTASRSWWWKVEIARVDATTAQYTKWAMFNAGMISSAQGYHAAGDPSWNWGASQDIIVRLTTPTQAGDAALKQLRVVYYPGVP